MDNTYDAVLEKHGYKPIKYGWKKNGNIVTLFQGNEIQVWKPGDRYVLAGEKDYDTGIIPCTPEQLDFLITILYR
jgi:hypothetical protein